MAIKTVQKNSVTRKMFVEIGKLMEANQESLQGHSKAAIATKIKQAIGIQLTEKQVSSAAEDFGVNLTFSKSRKRQNYGNHDRTRVVACELRKLMESLGLPIAPELINISNGVAWSTSKQSVKATENN